jgi:hypothetical protein
MSSGCGGGRASNRVPRFSRAQAFTCAQVSWPRSKIALRGSDPQAKPSYPAIGCAEVLSAVESWRRSGSRFRCGSSPGFGSARQQEMGRAETPALATEAAPDQLTVTENVPDPTVLEGSLPVPETVKV